MRFRLILSIAACLAAPGWGAIAVRANPKAGPIRKVCLLPVEASLARVGMKGGASGTKESEEWGAKVGAAVQHAITKAGAELIGDAGASAQDEEGRQAVLRIKQKYEGIAAQMRKKSGGVKKGRYTLGDEVSLVPCAAEADALAFVDATGLIQSGGRKAFDILAGGAAGILMAQGRYEIWIALVDAKSGEVAALLHDTALGGKTGKDPDGALSSGLADQFKKLHVGTVGP